MSHDLKKVRDGARPTFGANICRERRQQVQRSCGSEEDMAAAEQVREQ